MGEWFGRKNLSPFYAFEWFHIAMIIVYLIGVVFLLIYSNKFKQEKKLSHVIQMGIITHFDLF